MIEMGDLKPKGIVPDTKEIKEAFKKIRADGQRVEELTKKFFPDEYPA